MLEVVKKQGVYTYTWSVLIWFLFYIVGSIDEWIYRGGLAGTQFIVVVVSFSVALLLLCFPLRLRREWFTYPKVELIYSSWMFDLRLVLFAVNVVIVWAQAVEVLNLGIYSKGYPYWNDFLFSVLLYSAFFWSALHQLIWLWKETRGGKLFLQKVKEGWLVMQIKGAQDVFLKMSMSGPIIVVGVVTFFWGIGTISVIFIPQMIIVYLLCVLLIGFPTVVYSMARVGYINRLFVMTEQLAAGELQEEFPQRGKTVVTSHAVHLEQIRKGLKRSQREQDKSERLKTELISNVSHDLRTPLTAMITYTNLLKDTELTKEEQQKYIHILDRKSERLKKLIDDLFEVSKMATGNLKLRIEEVDLTQLLQQALAEHEEDFARAGLNVRVTLPESPLYAYVDGQRWWRLLDNLIVNAYKYSLPDTRVYLSLREELQEAIFIVKNVTRYELGENVGELMERFKRGDVSRHTEGSGLGLAIAQSIVDVHEGSMRVELDGDLFKVIVRVNKALI
ncbi:sensor histidine kinase KdpD [Mechercharimyces sp. CAU 1602]|uniref:sensor histidine kinase n=1 Tax=Mechercharimyces sp. CAU 1602 TaxID=2973933 RepID=UPI002162818C|nr:HAMP domain-containing sensor histidine kinase [Mechercharimyces sp. CAU 1602]MCS1352082.1 HAMP domain-containing histidine kinase [Mechercharimyces sp. CAU 1602]